MINLFYRINDQYLPYDSQGMNLLPPSDEIREITVGRYDYYRHLGFPARRGKVKTMYASNWNSCILFPPFPRCEDLIEDMCQVWQMEDILCEPCFRWDSE